MSGYHIIQTDNYGGDYPDESFLAGWDENKVHHNHLQLKWTKDPKKAMVWADFPDGVAQRINKSWGADHLRFATVVACGYQLKPGFEP